MRTGSARTRLDRVVPFEEARRLAHVNAWREKALVYLTRDPAEVLVLEHSEEFPSAGVQVPAGGVDPGEQPAQAAVRELAEETGLTIDSEPVYLESRIWHADVPSRVRHYFWMVAPHTTATRWSHVVSAGEDDEGMLFWLTFRPRSAPGLTSGYGWDAGMGKLDDTIAATNASK